MNVPDDHDFVLLVTWILSALSGRGPYPVLVIGGTPGAAKSTLARVLRALTDPSKTPLRSVQASERDAFVSAQHNHVIVLDNVDYLTAGQSDTLCKLSTGGGYDGRSLYTNDEEVVLDAIRPVIVTSIQDIAVRGDLASRAFILNLEDIPEDRYLTESEFWEAFKKDAPLIFGALLDGLATGLRRLPNVKPESLGRMADVAMWGAACETECWSEGAVAQALRNNKRAAAAGVMSNDPVATAIIRLMESKETNGQWQGTATDLLSRLSSPVFADENLRRSRSWPGGPNILSGRLKMLTRALIEHGIVVERDREGKGGEKVLRLSRASLSEPPQVAPAQSSASSAVNNNHVNQEVKADDCNRQPIVGRDKRLSESSANRQPRVQQNRAIRRSDDADGSAGLLLGVPEERSPERPEQHGRGYRFRPL